MYVGGRGNDERLTSATKAKSLNGRKRDVDGKGQFKIWKKSVMDLWIG